MGALIVPALTSIAFMKLILMRHSYYLKSSWNQKALCILNPNVFAWNSDIWSDTSFEVEISDVRDGFWAISEVGILAAREMTEMVSENRKFGNGIPTTNEMWGAYGGGEFS